MVQTEIPEYYLLNRTYTQHRLAEKINKFSENTDLHSPYTHQALAVYIDQDRFSFAQKVELFKGLVGELEEKVINFNCLDPQVRQIAQSELSCCKEDLVRLAGESEPEQALNMEFEYWSVLEHFQRVEKYAQDAVKDIPFERNRWHYLQVILRFAALLTGWAAVKCETEDGEEYKETFQF